eukprot:gb/GECH01008183.1/.p1 GENE.gb/GECH01008183.1/~~gb/GECH01008183.1/.p1  ORF type:complete len:337 (+),score=79.64 gb/GECH01008183.1/:1-1011(+)
MNSESEDAQNFEYDTTTTESTLLRPEDIVTAQYSNIDRSHTKETGSGSIYQETNKSEKKSENDENELCTDVFNLNASCSQELIDQHAFSNELNSSHQKEEAIYKEQEQDPFPSNDLDRSDLGGISEFINADDVPEDLILHDSSSEEIKSGSSQKLNPTEEYQESMFRHTNGSHDSFFEKEDKQVECMMESLGGETEEEIHQLNNELDNERKRRREAEKTSEEEGQRAEDALDQLKAANSSKKALEDELHRMQGTFDQIRNRIAPKTGNRDDAQLAGIIAEDSRRLEYLESELSQTVNVPNMFFYTYQVFYSFIVLIIFSITIRNIHWKRKKTFLTI